MFVLNVMTGVDPGEMAARIKIEKIPLFVEAELIERGCSLGTGMYAWFGVQYKYGAGWMPGRCQHLRTGLNGSSQLLFPPSDAQK